MTANINSQSPILPPMDKSLLAKLKKFMNSPGIELYLKSDDGAVVKLPSEVYKVLSNVVVAMQQGKAVTVAPVDLSLTTQEAAEILGISRPSVVKLLDAREINYEQPAQSHRRIRLSDLIEYQNRIRVTRSSKLDDLIGQAAKDGFYDDEIPGDFLEVVSEVRGSRQD